MLFQKLKLLQRHLQTVVTDKKLWWVLPHQKCQSERSICLHKEAHKNIRHQFVTLSKSKKTNTRKNCIYSIQSIQKPKKDTKAASLKIGCCCHRLQRCHNRCHVVCCHNRALALLNLPSIRSFAKHSAFALGRHPSCRAKEWNQWSDRLTVWMCTPIAALWIPINTSNCIPNSHTALLCCCVPVH